MSGHLMIVAGYMDLPLSHKLTLLKLCDSADDRTRMAFPGLDAVRLWAGTKRSRSLDVLKDLQEWGLLMQVTQGHRGHRATFKVFPEPGDEVFSLAAKKKQECPGAANFKGSPGIPTDAEIAERIAYADAHPAEQPGSFAKANEKRKGPGSRTQSEGSNLPDPSSERSTGSGESDPVAGERVQSSAGKGPAEEAIGSGDPDPFSTYLPTTNFQEQGADSLRSADAHEAVSKARGSSEPTTTPVVGLPETPTVKGKSASKAVRKTRLDPAWWPAEATRAWAQDFVVAEGVPLQLGTEAEQFKDHHIARGNVMVDWERAFQTWVRNAVVYARRNGGGQGRRAPGTNHQGQSPERRQESQREWVEAFG